MAKTKVCRHAKAGPTSSLARTTIRRPPLGSACCGHAASQLKDGESSARSDRDRAGKWIVEPRYTEVRYSGPTGYEIVGISKKFGIVAPSGNLVVPVKYDDITLFDDRAWVLAGEKLGLVLTDFAYLPPEQTSRMHDADAANLRKVRWRGDLVIISRGDFQNGLATSDGKILVDPIFNRIGEFHDDVAVAVDSRQFDEHHEVKFITSLITKGGEVLATNKYTDVSDFDGGVAWATHRWTDHRRPYQSEGWGLIDTSARELSKLSYVGAHWIWAMNDSYTDNMCPRFYGELAPVAATETYHRYGEKVWERNSWGYINRAGEIVAWSERKPQ